MQAKIRPSDIYKTPGARAAIESFVTTHGLKILDFRMPEVGETFIIRPFREGASIETMVCCGSFESPRFIVSALTPLLPPDWWE